MNYLLSFIAFVTSLILALVIIPWILAVAHRNSLHDVPDERKTHIRPVPRIGGISFFHCILFTILFTYTLNLTFFSKGITEQAMLPDISFLCALSLLYIGGLRDDLFGMRYRYKFYIQFVSALLIAFSGVYINQLYGLFGIEALTPWVGIPLTVLLIIFIINAMNLIDGIDGLSSGICIMALNIYGTLFLYLDVLFCAILAFGAIGVLCVFFYYNVFGSMDKKLKLFMGDSGSMMLGLILGFLSIRYMHYAPQNRMSIDNTLVVAVSPIILPMLDVLRVMFSRIKKRKHLFTADRNHIHHKLMSMGLCKSTTLITLLLISGGFCFFNFMLIPFLSSQTIFILDFVVWILGNMYLSHLISKRKAVIGKLVRNEQVA